MRSIRHAVTGLLVAVTTVGASVGIQESVSAAPRAPHSTQVGYSARDIILGLAGQGEIASSRPAAVVFEAKGLTAKMVDDFLATAGRVDPGFAGSFQRRITSGDPYQVRAALNDFVTMTKSVDRATAVAAADRTLASRSVGAQATSFWVVADAAAAQSFVAVTTADVIAEAVAVVVVVLLARTDVGSLTSDRTIASVTGALAA